MAAYVVCFGKNRTAYAVLENLKETLQTLQVIHLQGTKMYLQK